jgi:hypothetical protein
MKTKISIRRVVAYSVATLFPLALSSSGFAQTCTACNCTSETEFTYYHLNLDMYGVVKSKTPTYAMSQTFNYTVDYSTNCAALSTNGGSWQFYNELISSDTRRYVATRTICQAGRAVDSYYCNPLHTHGPMDCSCLPVAQCTGGTAVAGSSFTSTTWSAALCADLSIAQTVTIIPLASASPSPSPSPYTCTQRTSCL